MKKTLFTSLLALCMAGTAVADYSSTSQNSGVELSGGTYYGVAFTLADGITTTTGSSAEFTEQDTVYLSNITIDGRYENMSDAKFGTIYSSYSNDYDNLYLGITVGETIYYSSAVQLTEDVSGSLATLSFDFADVEISTGSSVQAFFYYLDESDSTYNKVTVALSASKMADSTSWDLLKNTAGTSFESNNYGPDSMTVTTSDIQSVPEPATASLSLLALAGLMIRRRRTA